MSDEFGPWIEHDGKGCPVKGKVVQCVWLSPDGEESLVASDGRSSGIPSERAGTDPERSSWLWTMVNGVPTSLGQCAPIIRYRVKNPKGLTILENLIADIYETAPAGWIRTDGLSSYDNGPLFRRKDDGSATQNLIAETLEEVSM